MKPKKLKAVRAWAIFYGKGIEGGGSVGPMGIMWIFPDQYTASAFLATCVGGYEIREVEIREVRREK